MHIMIIGAAGMVGRKLSQDGGASAAHRPVVSSVNHVPALLKLIHDGQVSCTAAGHFVSAAWALGGRRESPWA